MDRERSGESVVREKDKFILFEKINIELVAGKKKGP